MYCAITYKLDQDTCVKCIIMIMHLYILGMNCYREHVRTYVCSLDYGAHNDFTYNSYHFIKVPLDFTRLQECVNAVCRWVSGYGWGEGVKHITSPTDLRERVGHSQLCTIIIISVCVCVFVCLFVCVCMCVCTCVCVYAHTCAIYECLDMYKVSFATMLVYTHR